MEKLREVVEFVLLMFGVILFSAIIITVMTGVTTP